MKHMNITGILVLVISLGISIDGMSLQLQGEASAETGEAAPETLRHKDRAVGAMDLPLDGSTVESFQAGLEKVETGASEQEYRAVMSSLSYLLFYDLEIKRDKARLYRKLDGKTARQIVDEVRQFRGK